MARPIDIASVRAARDKAKKIGTPPPDAEARPEDKLPPGLPVLPLGVNGTTRYYLDADRQLVALGARDHSKLGLMCLFGERTELLYQHWPRHSKDGTVTGWRAELVAEALCGACSREGVWDPAERERGRGAWRGENGELVLHLGGRVLSFPSSPNPWRDHESHRPGLVGHYVYPAAAPAGAIAENPAPGGPGGPGEKVLLALETWNWKRPQIDAILMLGWIGSAMICGALDWRTVAWVTGGKGSGKSTLHKLLGLVMGGALIKVADATEAGISQALRLQTMPVAIDELEASQDNRRALSMVKLARNAASGGLKLRGGADHKGVEFVTRSSFFMSSILIPPLQPQDRSRMAILELGDFQPDAKPPDLDSEAKWREVGAQLRRRLVDGWGRYASTLEFFRAALATSGHSARGQDTFGTLLACADILLHDGAPAINEGAGWALDLEANTIGETEDDERDEESCLGHLLTTAIDVHRNGWRRTIAEWISIAAGYVTDQDEFDARRILETYGMKFLPRNGRDPPRLAFSNSHRGLMALFEGTHWAGVSGAKGAFVQALRRLPGADRPLKALYFAGSTSRATTVPLDVIVLPNQTPMPLADPQ